MNIRYSRFRKFRKRNRKTHNIIKLFAIGYLCVLNLTYLLDQTGAYFTSTNQLTGTIQAGTWETDKPPSKDKTNIIQETEIEKEPVHNQVDDNEKNEENQTKTNIESKSEQNSADKNEENKLDESKTNQTDQDTVKQDTSVMLDSSSINEPLEEKTPSKNLKKDDQNESDKKMDQ